MKMGGSVSGQVGQVVGLCGFAMAGKDSVAEVLTGRYGYTRVAFADLLRSMAYALNPLVGATPTPDGFSWEEHRLASVVDDVGWDEAKKHPEIRRTLQRLGTEAGRDQLGRDFWVDQAFKTVIPLLNEGKNVVLTDVRFPNEIRAVREVGGEIWRVDRPGYGPVNGHASEAEWTKVHPEVIVRNDGEMEDLRARVGVLVRSRGRLSHL